MIRIFTGYGDMGGSTIAFINLVNLLNENGYEAILYAPHTWMLDQCRSEQIDGKFLNKYFTTPRASQCVLRDYNILNQLVEDDDIVIFHLIPLYMEQYDKELDISYFDTSRLKKVIYSCHETTVYPVGNINAEKFDYVHYVSEFQRDWHNYHEVENVVIPNIISPIEKQEKTIDFEKVGGVIGTVTENKRTHVAVQAALDDGCDKVLVFGSTDARGEDYWNEHMKPFIDNDVVMILGCCDDKSLMYSDLDVVYHACQVETFNYIEKECAMLGIPYKHTDSMDKTPVPVITSNEDILKMWEKVFK